MIRQADAAVFLTLAATTMLVVVARSSGAVAAPGVMSGHGRAGAATAYAEGAPPGFSGGFSEQSCHACHFHGEVNSGPERVAIAGVPERFVAGKAYRLTVTLRRPDMKLAGFQLTARFKDDGAQAGVLAVAPGDDARVKVETQGDVQYANQRKEGTALAEPHIARWSVVWTAPDAPDASRPVVFHIAANAGDGDGTAEGDYVETATGASMPAAGSRGGAEGAK